MVTNRFPSFAEALYARPGVAAACLDLQDRRGFDVALLLHACWLGVRARALSPDQAAALVSVTVPWRFEIVRPSGASAGASRRGWPACRASIPIR